MIEVKKNFLNKQLFNEIKNLIDSNKIPWFYQNSMTNQGDGQEKFYFGHIIYGESKPNSDLYCYFEEIIKLLNVKSLIKIRASLSVNTNERYYSYWHTDQDFKCKTSLLYLNTNNGFTEIFDDENKIHKISCEENKMIIFDSYHKHRLVSQTDTPKRLTINFNYF